MLFHVGIEFLDIVNFIFSAIALVAHEPMGFLLGQVLELLERGLKEANLSMHLKMLLTRKYRKFFPNRRPTIAVVDTTPVPHPSAHLRILTQLYRFFAILWQQSNLGWTVKNGSGNGIDPPPTLGKINFLVFIVESIPYLFYLCKTPLPPRMKMGKCKYMVLVVPTLTI